MSLIGFDLGTSQSAGCYLAGKVQNKESYEVVENEMIRSGAVARAENEKFHPSYVQYDTSGRFIVAGTRAKLLADGFPRSTVYDAKRIIGRRFDDPEAQAIKKIMEDRGHYSICEADQQAKICVGQNKIAPEEVGAEIIVEMLKDAFQQENRLQVQKIVISVPAYFNNVQKLKTKEAAMLAIKKMKGTEYSNRLHINVEGKRPEDLQEITLIPEPSAAFITYMAKGGYKNVQKDKYVLVFDLGAGTLDITIGTAQVIKDPITREDRYTLDIKMTHGNTALGGRDMDQKIIEFVKEELARKNVAIDNRLMWQVREKVEKAKIELSTKETTNIVFLDRGVSIPLTKSKLEQMIVPLLQKCREEIRTALDKTKLKKGDVSAVVMVGGPTYMPCVKALVEEEVGIKIETVENWDPMLCVAEGAARSSSIVINEVIPYDYYISVEMFSGINVATKITSIGEPANLDKNLEIMVPMYRAKDLNDIKLKIVEVESNNGTNVKSECIQYIDLSLLAGSNTMYPKSFSPRWSIRELEPVNSISLNYGKIRMQCRVTKEGLIIQPTFINPGTGNKIEYPDLPVSNFGKVETIDQPAFDRNFGQYAQNIHLKEIEDDINKTVQDLMNEYHCTRQQALSALFQALGNYTPGQKTAYDEMNTNKEKMRQRFG